MTFQDMILSLSHFWGSEGCTILSPYDMEVGAGTFHPATTLGALGLDPRRVAYVQPSRRPTDGRYGDNPHRLGHYFQYQVLLKPSPADAQDLYLRSLQALGFDTEANDIRFVEDDWENPTIGASGLGWEVWCNGAEISQFTYFQQVGGLAVDHVSVELTYGLERIASVLQGCESVYDIVWNAQGVLYGDLFKDDEKSYSQYHFETASISLLRRHFDDMEGEGRRLLEAGLVRPAYDCCIKASHLFNILDARGAVSVVERASFIQRIRGLAKGICSLWVESKAQ